MAGNVVDYLSDTLLGDETEKATLCARLLDSPKYRHYRVERRLRVAFLCWRLSRGALRLVDDGDADLLKACTLAASPPDIVVHSFAGGAKLSPEWCDAAQSATIPDKSAYREVASVSRGASLLRVYALHEHADNIHGVQCGSFALVHDDDGMRCSTCLRFGLGGKRVALLNLALPRRTARAGARARALYTALECSGMCLRGNEKERAVEPLAVCPIPNSPDTRDGGIVSSGAGMGLTSLTSLVASLFQEHDYIFLTGALESRSRGGKDQLLHAMRRDAVLPDFVDADTRGLCITSYFSPTEGTSAAPLRDRAQGRTARVLYHSTEQRGVRVRSAKVAALSSVTDRPLGVVAEVQFASVDRERLEETASGIVRKVDPAAYFGLVDLRGYLRSFYSKYNVQKVLEIDDMVSTALSRGATPTEIVAAAHKRYNLTQQGIPYDEELQELEKVESLARQVLAEEAKHAEKLFTVLGKLRRGAQICSAEIPEHDADIPMSEDSGDDVEEPIESPSVNTSFHVPPSRRDELLKAVEAEALDDPGQSFSTITTDIPTKDRHALGIESQSSPSPTYSMLTPPTPSIPRQATPAPTELAPPSAPSPRGSSHPSSIFSPLPASPGKSFEPPAPPVPPDTPPIAAPSPVVSQPAVTTPAAPSTSAPSMSALMDAEAIVEQLLAKAGKDPYELAFDAYYPPSPTPSELAAEREEIYTRAIDLAGAPKPSHTPSDHAPPADRETCGARTAEPSPTSTRRVKERLHGVKKGELLPPYILPRGFTLLWAVAREAADEGRIDPYNAIEYIAMGSLYCPEYWTMLHERGAAMQKIKQAIREREMKRREDAMLSSLQPKPKITRYGKEIRKIKGMVGFEDFYEYSMDWKKRHESKITQDRKEKEAEEERRFKEEHQRTKMSKQSEEILRRKEMRDDGSPYYAPPYKSPVACWHVHAIEHFTKKMQEPGPGGVFEPVINEKSYKLAEDGHRKAEDIFTRLDADAKDRVKRQEEAAKQMKTFDPTDGKRLFAPNQPPTVVHNGKRVPAWEVPKKVTNSKGEVQLQKQKVPDEYNRPSPRRQITDEDFEKRVASMMQRRAASKRRMDNKSKSDFHRAHTFKPEIDKRTKMIVMRKPRSPIHRRASKSPARTAASESQSQPSPRRGKRVSSEEADQKFKQICEKLRSRGERIVKKQEEKQKKAMTGCTFKPEINRNSKKLFKETALCYASDGEMDTYSHSESMSIGATPRSRHARSHSPASSRKAERKLTSGVLYARPRADEPPPLLADLPSHISAGSHEYYTPLSYDTNAFPVNQQSSWASSSPPQYSPPRDQSFSQVTGDDTRTGLQHLSAEGFDAFESYDMIEQHLSNMYGVLREYQELEDYTSQLSTAY